MINIALLFFSIIELLKIDEKYKNYSEQINTLIAIGLWIVLGGNESFVPMALGAVISIKTLFKIKLPIELNKHILPLTIVSLAGIETSIIYSFIIVSITHRTIISNELKNIIGILILYLLSLFLKDFSLTISYISIFFCSIFIFLNYRQNNRFCLFLWILLQSKFALAVFDQKLYFIIEMGIVASIVFVVFVLWLEKRQSFTWSSIKKNQTLFVWYSTLQFGPFGFWLSLSFFAFIKEVISNKQIDDEHAVLKVKPIALTIFYLIPISLPVFFLINVKEIKTTVLGAIVSFLFLMVQARWFRELKTMIVEKRLDKWHILDISAIVFLTVMLSYRLVGGNILGIIIYASISILILVLVAGLKIDEYLFSNLSMPRLLLKLDTDRTIKTSRKALSNIKITPIDNLIKFMFDLFRETLIFVERNFLVIFILVFFVVFYVGGGFA